MGKFLIFLTPALTLIILVMLGITTYEEEPDLMFWQVVAFVGWGGLFIEELGNLITRLEKRNDQSRTT